MHTVMLSNTVAVTDIEVLGCGRISWKPPQDNRCEELNYIVRFFDGPTYTSTSGSTGYKKIQCDIGTDAFGRQWAIAPDLPTDGRTVYADVSVYALRLQLIFNTKYFM